MIPTDNNKDERFLTTLKTKYRDIKVLRRGAFFGPNASGKSVFIESIDFAKNYIVEAQKSNKNTRVPQFKGEITDLSDTSLFQFIFFLDGIIYDYGFTLTPKHVSEEWLMMDTDEGFVPMFTRVTDKNENTVIDIEDEFLPSDSEERILAEVLKGSIKANQKNQLFLHKLNENGINQAGKIVDWFKNINIIFPNSKMVGLPIGIKNNKNFQDFLSKCLNDLDTGVLELEAVNKKINFQEFAEEMDMPKELIKAIENDNDNSALISVNGKYYILFEDSNTPSLIQIKFAHKLNNKIVRFDIDDESEGTQRLLDLLPILFALEERSNSIYLIDEIDRSLHTKLSQYLVKNFEKKSCDLFSQILFTAHDVNLINLRDFNKEEIWFIEKNNFGETKLKPFSDFDTRENQDNIKDYLNGRFGAIPVIRGDI